MTSTPFRLDALLVNKRREIRLKKERIPAEAFQCRPFPPRRDFEAAIRAPGVSLIAEMKRRSPSAGPLAANLDPAAAASRYEASGARALSVLTDRRYFGGREGDVLRAKTACRLPVLRKEFILDEYQLLESAVLGADAVLLIARVLPRGGLGPFLAAAGPLGLACLVEVHDERDLDDALDAGARMIGVNNRNLETLQTDLAVSFRLAPRLPSGVLKVSESGIRTAADVSALGDAGFNAVLVGESILRSGDPETKMRELAGGLHGQG
jgi:indole-3-glycerol phosphate synthase